MTFKLQNFIHVLCIVYSQERQSYLSEKVKILIFASDFEGTSDLLRSLWRLIKDYPRKTVFAFYRGISLLPVLAKIFDMQLVNRANDRAHSECVEFTTSTNQNAYQQNLCDLFALFGLEKCVNYKY